MPYPTPLGSVHGARLRLLSFAFLAVAACTTSGPIEGTDAGDVATDADLPDATTDGSQVDASDAGTDSGSPDAAPPQGCSGTAVSCVGRTSGCDVGFGCVGSHFCVGTPPPCIALDQASCAEVHGCTWNGTMTKCTGAQVACSAHDTPESCDDQPGCAPTIVCSGRATPCVDLLDETTCLEQPRCLWTP